MTVERYKKLLGECRSELECRRLMHWHWSSLVGTIADIRECLELTDARARHFAIAEEGLVVGVCVQSEEAFA